MLRAQHDGVSNEQAQLLCSLAATLPRARVASAFAGLKGTPLASRTLTEELVRFATSLTAAVPSAFPGVLSAIENTAYRYQDLHTQLQSVLPIFARAGLTPIVVDAILTGGLGDLVGSAFKLAMIRDRRLKAPPNWVSTQPTPDWIAGYPHTFLEFNGIR